MSTAHRLCPGVAHPGPLRELADHARRQCSARVKALHHLDLKLHKSSVPGAHKVAQIQRGRQLNSRRQRARRLQVASAAESDTRKEASFQTATEGAVDASNGATKSASFFQDVNPQKEEINEDVGEVEKIMGSRVVDRKTQYLIKWADAHPDSWEPVENLAGGLVEEFEKEWWTVVRKAEEAKLKELLENGRDPDAIDPNERTALFFAAGMGSEKCVNVLLDGGANLHWQDKDGYTPLHIAAGYVHTSVVKALLDRGADPEMEDHQERSALLLAKQLLEKTPQNNPLQFGRRIALDQVVKMLDEAVFEEVEVEQVLDKRIGDGGVMEYLVRWSDGSEDSWEPAENIGEDLVKDFEQGLEYGIAEKVLEKRTVEGGATEYLVKWADTDEPTWEPEDNVAEEVIAEFEEHARNPQPASAQ